MNNLIYKTTLIGVEHTSYGLVKVEYITSYYSDGSTTQEKVYGEPIIFDCITHWC